MRSKLTLVFIWLFMFTIVAQQYPGFRVQGRHLYDKCGERVILRGINNPNIWFEKNGGNRYSEIKQTGANVIRIVWETYGTAAELDQAITNCIAEGLIPMVELHDATGDLSKLPECIDYWTNTDIVDIIIQHEEYLLINIANEAGQWGVTGTTFKNTYAGAVADMRDAGIHVPLIIDGTDWGKDINILQSQGPALIEADPDHNLMFSVHMWWPEMYGYEESDIGNEIDESVQMGLPLIVGEFSQMHGQCNDINITDENAIAYKTIIRECHENQVGYIAWSWFGNCNQNWDMSSGGTYETLYDWGLEVAVTDDYSIANTSRRPYFILHGECNPDVTPAPLSEPEEVTLMQNHPNPFSQSTRVTYFLSEANQVELVIYNSQGEELGKPLQAFQSPGEYSVEISAGDLHPGVYFYSLSTGGSRQTKCMLIIE
jgi:mannan endo-1,4-beta-mannosidase